MNPGLKAALDAHGQGRLDVAEQGYRRLLAGDPGHVDAANLLGVLLHQTGRDDEAVGLLERAVGRVPGFADAHSNLGMVLLALGRTDEAERALTRAIDLRPGHWNALGMRAELHRQRGELVRAEADLAAALNGNPRWIEGWLRLARVAAARDTPAGAVPVLERAIRLVPDHPDLLRELGALRGRAGDPLAALEALRRADAIAPGQARTLVEIGKALFGAGRYLDARETFRRAAAAIGADAVQAEISGGLGCVAGRLGLPDEALALLSEACRLAPANAAWGDSLLAAVAYTDRVDRAGRLRHHLDWAARHAVPPAGAPPRRPQAGPPWRVGLLSGDFRNHSVARFLLSWLGRGSGDFAYVAYSFVPREDEVTAALRSRFALWRDVARLSDEAVRTQVAADGIDILIDLSGHFEPNRVAVLAARAAPVQANWLGYPDTTGMTTVDYRLTDAICDPEADAAFATEALARPDTGFLCYTPIGEELGCAPAVRDDARFCFGSFNNLSKLTPEVLDAYARILQAAPTAILRLKNFAFDDPAVRDWMRERLAAAGGDPMRVELLASAAASGAHLSSYDHVDVALDSFPFNGATTTCEALWMGVPVLTLRGDRHAARVSESLLRRVLGADAEPWIAFDVDDWVARAAKLAAGGCRPMAARRALRARVEASPLMDGDAFAHGLEVEFRRWIGRAS